jgi:hypothetical protein
MLNTAFDIAWRSAQSRVPQTIADIKAHGVRADLKFDALLDQEHIDILAAIEAERPDDYVKVVERLDAADARAAELIRTRIQEFAANKKAKPMDRVPFVKDVIWQVMNIDSTQQGLWELHKDSFWGHMTIQELYIQYLNEFQRSRQFADSEQQRVPAIDRAFPIAFKDPSKRRALFAEGYQLNDPKSIPTNYFPLKLYKKKYALKHVSPPNTWYVDMLMFGDFAWYAFINANTRYLLMLPANFEVNEDSYRMAMAMNDKGKLVVNKQAGTSIYAYLTALEQVVGKVTVWYIVGDGQQSFNSDDVRIREFYRTHGRQPNGIEFIPTKRLVLNSFAKRTDPLHQTLAIIDRVGRTLRDMYYRIRPYSRVSEADVLNIGPGIMRELVQQYNSSPHKTLTRYGPGFEISPQMAQNDPELEFVICRSITQANWRTTQTQGFYVPIGSLVRVYNSTGSMDKRRSQVWPELGIVRSYQGGVYHVVLTKSHIPLSASRWQLENAGRPIDEPAPDLLL